MKITKSLLLTTTVLAALSMNASASLSPFGLLSGGGTTFVGAQVGASAAKAGKPTQGPNSWKTLSSTFNRSNKWSLNGGVLVGHEYQYSKDIALSGIIGFNMESAKSQQKVTLGGIPNQSTVKRTYVANLLLKAGHTGMHSKFVPFITAGAALTRFNFDVNKLNGANDANTSKTTFGWAGGAGLDYRLNSTTSVGAQYLYTWYPNTKKQLTLGGPITYTLYAPKGYHAATIGVNVKI